VSANRGRTLVYQTASRCDKADLDGRWKIPRIRRNFFDGAECAPGLVLTRKSEIECKAARPQPFFPNRAQWRSERQEIQAWRSQRSRKAPSHGRLRNRSGPNLTFRDGTGCRFGDDSVNFPQGAPIFAQSLRILDGNCYVLHTKQRFLRRRTGWSAAPREGVGAMRICLATHHSGRGPSLPPAVSPWEQLFGHASGQLGDGRATRLSRARSH